ncbi:GNAT family N-acetyltransferase [Hymenobacter koreensis]|uniref:GNAT family N-acetyltransferase n=1 Tax=Hymenobacter koreensis TaxID=1084523 RepID=A0ABP8IVT2_9BACT
MQTSLHLVSATPADVPELLTLVNRAYRGEAGAVAGWTNEAHLLEGPRTSAAALTELLTQPAAAILACRMGTNGPLVGSVYVQVQAPKLYLGMLAVTPEHQALGIGKFLLQAAEHHATQHACRSVVMTVLSARPELLAWYQRRGYLPTGVIQPFPTGPDHGTPKQELSLVELEKTL